MSATTCAEGREPTRRVAIRPRHAAGCARFARLPLTVDAGTVTTNPWLSAYMSAANRAYNMAAQSMLAQTRAATRAQQAQFKKDVLAAQREFTQEWLDLWMPTGGSSAKVSSRSSSRKGSGSRRSSR